MVAADAANKLHSFRLTQKGNSLDLFKAAPSRQFELAIVDMVIMRSSCTGETATINLVADESFMQIDIESDACLLQRPLEDCSWIRWLHSTAQSLQVAVACVAGRLQMWDAAAASEPLNALQCGITETADALFLEDFYCVCVAADESQLVLRWGEEGQLAVIRLVCGKVRRAFNRIQLVVELVEPSFSGLERVLGFSPDLGLLGWTDNKVQVWSFCGVAVGSFDVGHRRHKFGALIHMCDKYTVICVGAKAVICLVGSQDYTSFSATDDETQEELKKKETRGRQGVKTKRVTNKTGQKKRASRPQ